MSLAGIVSQIDTSDVVLLSSVFVAALLYLFRNSIFTAHDPLQKYRAPLQAQTQPVTHSPPTTTSKKHILHELQANNKTAVVFYGSQTGTAEDYAVRIAKEAGKFGLQAMVCDIEEFSFESLAQLTPHHLVFFVMATYGEGEPTDNALDFWKFLSPEDLDHVPEFEGKLDDPDQPLQNLRYLMFGLGNKTYEHYNAVSKLLDRKLLALGAKRVSAKGEGDDDANLEEDFMSWKERMWRDVCDFKGISYAELSLDSKNPDRFAVHELDSSDLAFSGEISERKPPAGPPVYDLKNPYQSPFGPSRELFTTLLRSCIHAEFALPPEMHYQAGDHLAIWPINSEDQIDRLLSALGLAHKADTVFKVSAVDPTAKSPFPNPTTYRVALRHYLDITTPPSRQFLSNLAVSSSNPTAKSFFQRLGNDKQVYHDEIVTPKLTLAEILQLLNQTEASQQLAPENRFVLTFSACIDGLTRLQPRYYSISSTPLLHPNSVHITAVTLKYSPAPDRTIFGVCTNFLRAAHLRTDPQAQPMKEDFPVYHFSSPAQDPTPFTMPVYIRHSNFKLPKDPGTAVIMVGPGTGVAPFRGFVMERSHLASNGLPVGPTILFYGCRNRNEDFLYKDEWPTYFEKLSSPSQLITAFSREESTKIYVQHKLREHKDLVWSLISQGAHFYVCGDAKNMARDVNKALVDIVEQCSQSTPEQAVKYVKELRHQGRYLEDVWS